MPVVIYDVIKYLTLDLETYINILINSVRSGYTPVLCRDLYTNNITILMTFLFYEDPYR